MSTLGEKVARYGAFTKQGVLERMGITENTAEPKELRDANKVCC
jgi:peroxiredoxin